MKRPLICPVILLTLATAAVEAHAGDAKQMADAYANSAKAMALLRCKVGDDSRGQNLMAMAVCVAMDNKGLGVFMTMGLNRTTAAQGIQDMTLRSSGIGGKEVPARLIGLDPVTDIAFVQATQKHDWGVVKFAAKSNVSIGQAVVSVGMLPPNDGLDLYVGSANVSAVLRVPERLAYVTGGHLTNIGSPVYAQGSAAIGIVSPRQLFRGMTVATGKGSQTLSFQGIQETAYFLPVEEFSGALKRIGAAARGDRPVWIGVLQVQGAEGPVASLANLQTPGVALSQVAPGGPAHKAGLQDRDVIVSINGKPLEELALPNLVAANFVRQILQMAVGTKVRLGVARGAERSEKTVTLEAMPPMPMEAPRAVSTALGFIVRDLVWLDRSMGTGTAAQAKGIVIMQLQPEGSAQNAGLKAGDTIVAVDGKAAGSVSEFQATMANVMKDTRKMVVSVHVMRQDKAQKFDVAIRR